MSQDDQSAPNKSTPGEVLEHWEHLHGPLSDSLRRKFLERDEIEELQQLPVDEVVAALPQKKLDRILRAAVAGHRWRTSPCEEDGVPFCQRCKPVHLIAIGNRLGSSYPARVWVTDGIGVAFHAGTGCKALLQGQATVTDSEVRAVALQHALDLQKRPCLICFPKEPSG